MKDVFGWVSIPELVGRRVEGLSYNSTNVYHMVVPSMIDLESGCYVCFDVDAVACGSRVRVKWFAIRVAMQIDSAR